MKEFYITVKDGSRLIGRYLVEAFDEAHAEEKLLKVYPHYRKFAIIIQGSYK